jgi:hypothetical protein
MDIRLRKGFRTTGNTGFNYETYGEIGAGEEIIIPLPVVTANKRGVNDIGWQIDGDATLYATLSNRPLEDGTIWQEIRPDEGINKTAANVKIVGGMAASKVYLRVILN